MTEERPTTDDSLLRAIDIARAVRDLGGRALIVGGWVRDGLLPLPTTQLPNIDLEVFESVAPDGVTGELRGTNRLGSSLTKEDVERIYLPAPMDPVFLHVFLDYRDNRSPSYDIRLFDGDAAYMAAHLEPNRRDRLPKAVDGGVEPFFGGC